MIPHYHATPLSPHGSLLVRNSPLLNPTPTTPNMIIPYPSTFFFDGYIITLFYDFFFDNYFYMNIIYYIALVFREIL